MLPVARNVWFVAACGHDAARVCDSGSRTAIDPGQQQALTTLGNIAAAYEWDCAKATRIYDKLFARHPASVQALCERAFWVSIVVAPDTGCEHAFADLHLALKLDPLNAWVNAMLGIAQALTASRLGNSPRPATLSIPMREFHRALGRGDRALDA